MAERPVSEAERAIRERDFFESLLALGTETGFEPFLQRALELVVALTGARQGYLELRDVEDDSDAGTWWMARGFSDIEVDEIRSAISRGIIAEALTTGETVLTHSAQLDDRFRERASVKIRRIDAVLCVPLGEGSALGVVYLQGRAQGGAFSDEDRHDAETFARHLAPLAHHLLFRRREAVAGDATRELRARHRLDGIVGRSPALAEALAQAMLAAPLDVNVLLRGDSGTGKSQLARAIHANSPRAHGPFVEINCAALPSTLFESELFGARAGSHSEAKRDQRGKVTAAEGGTLFLDEVAEIPLEAQPKLLQLLQSRRYFPLGAADAVEADVRLVAATNCDLEEAVREKRFREDLLFRLQVLPVRMPSLRERREDVALLARALCGVVAARHRLGALALSPGAQRAIESAEWPGNVRQLENALEAAVIRAAGEGATGVEARHVFERIPEDAVDDAPTFQEATRRFQRRLLKEALDETGWNVAAAARRLDLARSHVYNLIGAFGLRRG
jgi:Nif-specific regulatory protein